MEKLLKLYVYVDGDVGGVPFPNAEDQIEIGAFRYDAKRMGGAPSITASVNYPSCLDDEWTDNVYAEFNGERYFLKQTPTSSYDNADAMYKHDIELVSERVALDNVYFFDVVTGDPMDSDKPVSNSTKVVFFGSVRDFASRLQASLDYSGLDYEVIVDSDVTSEEKLMSFEDQFFSNVLQEVYNTYNVPYYFDGKRIHIGFAKNQELPTFAYGVDDALISITKNNANYKIVNRVTGTGSSENLPYYYPNSSPKGDLVVEILPEDAQIDVAIVDMEKFSDKVEVGGEIEYKDYAAKINGAYTLKSMTQSSVYVSGSRYPIRFSNRGYKASYFIDIYSSYDTELPMYFNPLYSFSFEGNSVSAKSVTTLVFSNDTQVASLTYGSEVKIPLKRGKNVVAIYVSYNMGEVYSSDLFDGNIGLEFSLVGDECWYYKDKAVELSDLGLKLVDGEPLDGFVIKQRLARYINPTPNLMPSKYRETEGANRFYNATNGTYEGITFNNPFVVGKPKEHIIKVEDVKPTIEGAVNSMGLRMDMFSEFAYDLSDNDDLEENEEGTSSDYVHSYFFGKLRKLDFNLFDHAIENQPMVISFTSGDCGACNFEIGVTEEFPQKNPVQVNADGTIKRNPETGNVICGQFEEISEDECQPQQQDTINNEVWIALKKEDSTYGILMPKAPVDGVGGHRPSTDDTFVILGINLPQSYILNAEKKLEAEIIKYLQNNNDEKFTFSISFSRIYFEENPDVLALLSENSKIQITYNNKNYDLYVSSFSYSMGEGDVLPEIRIELDETLKTSQNALQNAISEVKSTLGNAINQVSYKISTQSRSYVSKVEDDTALGTVDFSKGIKFGEGGKVDILENNSAKLTIEYLEVTKKASFTSLEIQEKTHVGGQILVTPAAINCGEVEEFDDYYRCYFQTKGEDGEEIFNQFAVGDQAICQTFNAWGSRYYWRLVVGIGNDYIDLSKTDCDEGSGVPSAGDKIIQMGNRSDASRQNAIVIAAYGNGSPYIIQYKGINNYSLPTTSEDERIMTKLSPTENILTGLVRMKAGSSGLEKFTEWQSKQELIDSKASKGDFEDFKAIVEDDLDLIKRQVDGAITTWFYDPVPTLENAPAAEWTTEDDKINHLGDLYYSGEGKAYRFQYDNGTSTYYWNVITDTDIIKALADAKRAQDTADGKRRVFVTQPYPPYDEGDLWSRGSEFPMMVCVNSRESGSYVASDWDFADNNNQLSNEIAGYEYLKEAIQNGDTVVVGGLIQSGVLMLGYNDAYGNYHVMSGTNGIYRANEIGGGIAAWWGGDMSESLAKAVIRFDGTGFLANGNIRWDEEGGAEFGGGDFKILADGSIIFGKDIKISTEGDETLGSILTELNNRVTKTEFNTWKTDVFNPLSTKVDTNTANINKLLGWFNVDADGNLFTTYNFYSTKEISANGISQGTGGGGSGLISSVLGVGSLGATLTNDNSVVFNAYATNEIYKTTQGHASRIGVLESQVGQLTTQSTKVSVSDLLTTGTKIATITVDGVAHEVKGDFLPTSGGTITGSLIIGSQTDTAGLRFATTSGNSCIYVQNGEWRVTNLGWTYDYSILHSGNIGDYALKTDGSNYMKGPLVLQDTTDISIVNNMGIFVGRSNKVGGAAFDYASFINIPDRGISQLQLSWHRAYNNLKLVTRIYESNNWSDWKTIAFTSDLENYLPLTGGTISTNSEYYPLIIKGLEQVGIRLQQDTVSLGSFISSSKNTYIYNFDSGVRLGIFDGVGKLGDNTLLHSGNIGEYAFTPRAQIISNTDADTLITNGVYLNATGNGSGNSNFSQSYSIFATFAQSEKYLVQLSIGYNTFYFRRKIDTWDDWREVIHSGNIGSQSVNESLFTSCFKKTMTYAASMDLNTLNTGGMAVNYESTPAWVNGPTGMHYGLVLNLKAESYNSLQGQLAWDIVHNSTTDTTRYLYWRASDDGTFTEAKWHQIAFTDSNVASATKLETKRKLWGNDFDGTGDVSGNINLNLAKLIWHGAESYSISCPNTATAAKLLYQAFDGHQFEYAGGIAMLINSHGNVTIGDYDYAGTNPKLYVDGKTITKFVESNEYGVGNVSWGLDSSSQGLALLALTGNVYMPFGNVLIGTTDDNGAKLQVNGNAKIEVGNRLHIFADNAFVSYDKTIGGFFMYGGIREGEALSCEIAGAGGSWVGPGFKLMQNGNFGIGTSNPQYKLDVNGEVRVSALRSSIKDFIIYGYDGTNYVNAVDIDCNSSSLWIGYGSAPRSYNTNIAGNNVYLRYGTSRTTGLILNSSGNVTIGGSDLVGGYQLHKLCIDGVLAMPKDVTRTVCAVLGFSEDNLYLGYSNTNTYNTIIGGKNVILNPRSNVLIGTTTDSGEKLQVNGVLRVQRGGDANSYLNIEASDVFIKYKGYDKSDGFTCHVFYSNDNILMNIDGYDDITYVKTSFSVDKNAIIDGTLTIAGATTHNGIAYFGGTTYYINTSGNAHFNAISGISLQVDSAAFNGTIHSNEYSGSVAKWSITKDGAASFASLSNGGLLETSTLRVSSTSTFTGKTNHNGGIGATSLNVSGTSSLLGHVGIGASSHDDYSLYISGPSYMTGDLTVNGTLYADDIEGSNIYVKTSYNLYLHANGYVGTYNGRWAIDSYGNYKGQSLYINPRDNDNVTNPYDKNKGFPDEEVAVFVNGDIAATGEISANAISLSSDIRFKHQLGDIALNLDTIANAPMFRFTWTNKENSRVQIGTSAQYWKDSARELVSVDKDDFHRLDYATLGVLIGVTLGKTVKNHEDRIKELETKVESLEAENRRLRYEC